MKWLSVQLSDRSGRRKKEGSSCLFVHQWIVIRHIVDVKVSKIKFTNISNILLKPCIYQGEVKVAFNDSLKNVPQLHKK